MSYKYTSVLLLLSTTAVTMLEFNVGPATSLRQCYYYYLLLLLCLNSTLDELCLPEGIRINAQFTPKILLEWHQLFPRVLAPEGVLVVEVVVMVVVLVLEVPRSLVRDSKWWKW